MYASLLEKIFKAYPMYHKIGSTAYKEGLENIEILADITGNPQKNIRTIHVAGTNGKGSVAHLLAFYFREAGLRTGLYTSPHLVDFRERIKVNGTMISEKSILDFFDQFQEQFDRTEPSFFEMTTMLAFHYFAQQKVDIAIIETGLGGRLDATNIITPELSVITNISLDHTHLLGNSIEKIAYEKAGIIKPCIPVVVGEHHPYSFPIFEAVAQQNESPLFLADRHFQVYKKEDTIHILKENSLWASIPNISLLGNYQLRNLCTFAQAVDVLQHITTPEPRLLHSAVRNFNHVNDGLRGRWEQLSTDPHIICDVGHNPAGIAAITEQLQSIDYTHLHFVIGMVDDKDLETVIALLPQKNTTYYLCRADIPRALPPEKLAELMAQRGLPHNICTTVQSACLEARKSCRTGELIFIGGSCFVVGEALKSR